MVTRTTSTSVSGEIQFYQVIEPRDEDEKMAITVFFRGIYVGPAYFGLGGELRNWSALHEPLECMQGFSFWPKGF